MTTKMEIKDPPFRSEIILHTDGATNHVLKIYLGLCLQRISAPPATFNDFNGNSFNIRNWTEGEWHEFRSQIFGQSDLWNDRFWLIPPDDLNTLDIQTQPNRVRFRPNIKCELFVQVWLSPANANKTIKVARLADGYSGDSSLFRSDAVTYDSLDGVAHVFHIPDNTGAQMNINHYTIPHEIGHALGQPHIGVLRRTAACTTAIAGPTAGDDTTVGGSNSHRCYGFGEPPSIAENIMGYGLRFDDVNAQPWRDRIAQHTKTKAENWKVSLTPVAPKRI